MDRVHLKVSGLVQGVMFRAFVQDHADALGVTGWVRNLWNGDVEVVAEGARAQLEKLIEHCRRGPRHAQVDDVAIEWQKATGEFNEFRIAY